MRITLAAIGRLKDGAERDLFSRYAERIDKTGRALAIGPLACHELPESRAPTPAARKDDEAQRLLGASADAGTRIALDEHAKPMTSAAFAQLLETMRDEGTGHLAFLIGGPDGHGATVLEAATRKLSLGPMTLPHGLARIVWAEQVYRAITILSGHPYHRA